MFITHEIAKLSKNAIVLSISSAIYEHVNINKINHEFGSFVKSKFLFNKMCLCLT